MKNSYQFDQCVGLSGMWPLCDAIPRIVVQLGGDKEGKNDTDLYNNTFVYLIQNIDWWLIKTDKYF